MNAKRIGPVILEVKNITLRFGGVKARSVGLGMATGV